MADQPVEVSEQHRQGLAFRWMFFCLTALALVLLGAAAMRSSEILAKTAGVLLILGFVAAFFVRAWTGFRFTLWILIANTAAMLVPEYFRQVGGFNLSNTWLLLIVVQLIMFGMGTQMSYRDFILVAKMPKGVFVGIVCHFLLMPLLGVTLARLFRFPPEISAGVILIGSCSSGLASNVLTYLARGNLALSVTVTAASTALAPLMTPLLMKLLAGRLITVDVAKMSFEIIKLVIVPILAAFVHDWLTNSSQRTRRFVLGCSAIGSAWLIFLSVGGWAWLTTRLSDQSEAMTGLVSMPGFLAAAFVFGTLYHYAVIIWPKIEDWMPTVSMFGIVYFTLIATAKGRDHLLAVGGWLVVSTFLHNLLGFVLGYLGARFIGMNQRDSRTVAIEVGTQNGSMAVGIATAMNKVETVGLAAIVFAPMMNITGSMIANFWRQQDERAGQDTV